MTKNMNGVVSEWDGVHLTTFTPNQNEAIVLHFNFSDCTIDQLIEVFNNLKNEFKDNPIMVIPDRSSLECWNKDQLRAEIKIIEEIIEEL